MMRSDPKMPVGKDIERLRKEFGILPIERVLAVMVRRALLAVPNNQYFAAELVGISRSTLRRIIAKSKRCSDV